MITISDGDENLMQAVGNLSVVFISRTENVVLAPERLDTYADLYGFFRFLWTLLALYKRIAHCCISLFLSV